MKLYITYMPQRQKCKTVNVHINFVNVSMQATVIHWSMLSSRMNFAVVFDIA